MAVFSESDVGSTVACAKCYDGRCGGNVGNLYASVKVEEPAVGARGLASVARTGVQTTWTANNQMDVVCDGHWWAVSFRLGGLNCQLIMLVESCKDLVWCVSRGYAGNDDKWLGKSEAVVGEWRAGAW